MSNFPYQLYMVITAIMLTGLILFSGCRKGSEIPDVSEVDGSFQLIRFENKLFEPRGSDTLASFRGLQSQYPQLWNLYFQYILPIREPEEDSLDLAEVKEMILDPRMLWLADTVAQIQPFNERVVSELEQSFQYYIHYFPERQTPHIYTLISDFSYFPFIFPDSNFRDAVGISLEMFLGEDFPYRLYTGNIPVFSNYLLRTYNSEHIAKKTMDVIIDDMMGPVSGDRLLDLMIRNGKQMYILEKFMPFAEDTIITEYSPAQLQWCRDNERNLWAYLLDEDLLYSIEVRKFQKLVQHSPGVPGLPPEAPGRTANWVGLQIVKAFMNRNSNLSLRDLIELRDPQEILDNSKYKPL